MRRSQYRMEDFSWGLLGAVLCILFVGIINLHSSAAMRNPDLYLTQLYWVLLGFVIISVINLFDYRMTENLAYLFYFAACVALLMVLFFGKSAGGARRWLALGPIVFQPSEIAKLATIFCLARYFAERPGGYTLLGLVRPLNLSRPLVLLFALIWAWSKPWFVDPIGFLARFLVEKFDNIPVQEADLLWFRLLIIGFLVLSLIFTYYFVDQFESKQALLEPWSRAKRKRVIIGWAAFYAGLLCLLLVFWQEAWIKDPVGYLLNSLWKEAHPGGAYAQVNSGWLLRALVVVVVLSYLLLSLQSWKSQRRPNVEEKLIAPIDLLLIPAILIMVEPDLGTAGIVVLIGMTMIWVVGVQARSQLIMLGCGSLLALVGWFGVLKEYQKRRILTFLAPEEDITGAGWNAYQSLIAVGSGRWFGKGHREGSQTQLSFLPEQHTDFAFSVWAEEHGLFGCAAILFLYFLFLLITFKIAMDARERYGALLATGIGALIFWQSLINISMVTGMFPVVGMPLPLFSYGGSSLLSILLGIGFLFSIGLRCRTP